MAYTNNMLMKELDSIKLQPLTHLEKEDFPLLNKDKLGAAYMYKFKDAVKNFNNSVWQQCYHTCTVLIDITWEHLNIGNWKDVDITWRYAYSYCSLYKALSQYAIIKGGDSKFSYSDCIKTCDMGLLMGAPVLDNLLTKLATYFHGSVSVEPEEKSPSHPCQVKLLASTGDAETEAKRLKLENSSLKYDPIPVLKCPSLEYFASNYLTSDKPVILQDCMSYWPCMGEKKWTCSYIKQIAGKRTVPIEIGSQYTEEDWTQKLMTIEEFIEQYMENGTSLGKVGYLAQHELFDQIPELHKDISIPTYCGLGEDPDVNINAWFGPGGTVSPLHQDPKNNFLCQVMGKKYLKLYTVDQTPFLYPHEGHLLSNTSQVDVDNPDLKKFPKFAEAKGFECVLQEGDMLYIPEKCWHFVKSLSPSFSVSFWWR